MSERDEYIGKFDPYRDKDGQVLETSEMYVKRMQTEHLPHWPEEVLTEWFYRHRGHLEKYAFLRYETFHFEQQTWPLAWIPGREAFDHGDFCDKFSNIQLRAEKKDDWLANHMLKHGTWNTPIVLLHNLDSEYRFPCGKPLKSPYHLLEGHRRLSFLNGLRNIDKALAEHKMWLVRLGY